MYKQVNIGDKFGKLTFIEEIDPRIRINGSKRRRALYKCNCGVVKDYDYFDVKCGHTKQCYSCSRIIASEKRKTHGLVTHPLYSKWLDMKNRCYNPNVDRFKNYGGRGIRVCDEWKNNFKGYHDWAISNGWEKHLQIDRKNNDGNYSPENCRFVTRIEQGFNKTNTYYVEYKGEKIGLSKILYLNNKSNKYCDIWHGIKRGRSFNHYVEKYNLDMRIKQLSKTKMYKV